MNMINKQTRRLFIMATQDWRARLSPKPNNKDVLGPKDKSNLLFPLFQTNGVLFPYTPDLSSGGVVEYDPTTIIHTNYGYSAYVRSYPKPISMTAEFTAQTNDEALYLLAVMHFFRSVTKSYYGINPYNKAGTPPPVLLFNYLGDYQYKNVPVVIKSFDFKLEPNVDYVPVYTGAQSTTQVYSTAIAVSLPNAGGFTYVPAHLSLALEMDMQYTPIDVRNNFNLDDFITGKLYNKGYI